MKCRKTGNRLWTCRRAPAILILACFESFSAKPKLRPKPGCPGDSRRRSAYFTAYANRCGRVPGGHVIDGGDRLVSLLGGQTPPHPAAAGVFSAVRPPPREAN